MPDPKAVSAARKDAREGKSPSVQAGEFVREEFHHIREGKHGARSAKQAVAIGLSEARRAGVKLPARPGVKADKPKTGPVSRTRSRATEKALKHEGHAAGSRSAISRQSRSAAASRTPAQRSASAHKAARTRAAHGRTR